MIFSKARACKCINALIYQKETTCFRDPIFQEIICKVIPSAFLRINLYGAIARFVDIENLAWKCAGWCHTEHNGSTVQVLLISLITIWRTLGPDEMPRGPLSTSETDGTRSYKYQPAISHVYIGNSRVTNTRSFLLPLLATDDTPPYLAPFSSFEKSPL